LLVSKKSLSRSTPSTTRNSPTIHTRRLGNTRARAWVLIIIQDFTIRNFTKKDLELNIRLKAKRKDTATSEIT
jgi:hypothetical protein